MTAAEELAIDLLARIAEDPVIPSRYRVAARKHLRKLEDLAPATIGTAEAVVTALAASRGRRV